MIDNNHIKSLYDLYNDPDMKENEKKSIITVASPIKKYKTTEKGRQLLNERDLLEVEDKFSKILYKYALRALKKKLK